MAIRFDKADVTHTREPLQLTGIEADDAKTASTKKRGGTSLHP